MRKSKIHKEVKHKYACNRKGLAINAHMSPFWKNVTCKNCNRGNPYK